ncbi:Hypothetical predicted protein [Lecanosticta acicola]|uniref:Uncharacterized protein n=1 Tax=Lecanosticta acicola TaxID=111012 RepID=A0AAI8YT33_9PEZI|nr:Hypothetical predicted protein [Lecanosticta acicola]
MADSRSAQDRLHLGNMFNSGYSAAERLNSEPSPQLFKDRKLKQGDDDDDGAALSTTFVVAGNPARISKAKAGPEQGGNTTPLALDRGLELDATLKSDCSLLTVREV